MLSLNIISFKKLVNKSFLTARVTTSVLLYKTKPYFLGYMQNKCQEL